MLNGGPPEKDGFPKRSTLSLPLTPYSLRTYSMSMPDPAERARSSGLPYDRTFMVLSFGRTVSELTSIPPLRSGDMSKK